MTSCSPKSATSPRSTYSLSIASVMSGSRSPGRSWSWRFGGLRITGRYRRNATTLVHGDFRLGNVIVNRCGLAAVLDWELVHRGDPMEDLGYLCLRAWRFGAPLPVAGVGTFDQLFNAYESARDDGFRVDRDAVRWWQIAGTLSWGNRLPAAG